MPQRRKEAVREAILTAAGETFAEVGFERATLGDIVARAGTSIGNLYKYFANKEELFGAFLPRQFVKELEALFVARVEALGASTNPLAVEKEDAYGRASEELLGFTLRHRPRVVFLLLRSDGTRYAKFPEELVRLLVGLALSHAERRYPTFVVTPRSRRALTRIYRGFVAALGSIVDEERSDRALREAVAHSTAYHLSGLDAFFVRAPATEADGGT